MNAPSTPHPLPTLALRADRLLLRGHARSRRYLLVSLTAPEAPARESRLPVTVALVLDRSGSMAGERKFTLARRAVEQALAMLRPEDTFTLVTYDDRVDVLVPATRASAEAKRHAIAALAAVDPRGSTDLCAGWMRGCEQLAAHLVEGGVARALLLTDGLANAGITDHETLARHAGELRRRGIVTSTFGVGADFDERLLRDLAHEGGGNFYFVEHPAQIPDLLTSELGEALEVVLRGAALRVTVPPGAHAEPLNRFRHGALPDERGVRIELGDLVSGQEVSAVVAVRFADGVTGTRAAVQVALDAEGALPMAVAGVVEFTYATHAENDRQPRDRVVDRAVATLYAARARAEATEANRHGDFGRARRVLERTAARIMEYAGDDDALRREARALEVDLPQFAEAVMSPMEMKASFYAAELSAKGRGGDGRARRRPGA